MRRVKKRPPSGWYCYGERRALERGLPYRRRTERQPGRGPRKAEVEPPAFTLRDLARYVARSGALPSRRGSLRLHWRGEPLGVPDPAHDCPAFLRALDRLIGLLGPDATAEDEDHDGVEIYRRRSDGAEDEEEPAAAGSSSSPAPASEDASEPSGDADGSESGASPGPSRGPHGKKEGQHEVGDSAQSAPRRLGAEARESGPGESDARTPGNRGKSSLQTAPSATADLRPAPAQGLGPPVGAPPGARAEDPGTPTGRDERTGGQGEAVARAQSGRADPLPRQIPDQAEPHRPGQLPSTEQVDAPAGHPSASTDDGEGSRARGGLVVYSSPVGAPCRDLIRGYVSGSPSACDDAKALMLSLDPKRRAVARKAVQLLNQLVQGWVAAAEADEEAPLVDPRKLVRELVQRSHRIERCRPARQERPQVLFLGDVSGSCSAVCTETWAVALTVAAAWPGVVVAAQNSNCDLQSVRFGANRTPLRGGVVGGGPWGDALHAASLAGDTRPWADLVKRPPAPLAGLVAFGDTHGLDLYQQLGTLAPVFWLDSDLVNNLAGPVQCTRSWWAEERRQLFPHHRADYYIGVNNADSMLAALDLARRRQ